MATKVFRMEADCDAIIRKYAPDGSLTDGIREMERLIRDLKDMKGADLTYEVGATSTGDRISKWFPTAPELVDGMPKEYWTRLSKELERVIKIYAGEK